ncbi:MAG: hypothetical protein AABY86_04760 [Bdellovibrionota bacterium]
MFSSREWQIANVQFFTHKTSLRQGAAKEIQGPMLEELLERQTKLTPAPYHSYFMKARVIFAYLNKMIHDPRVWLGAVK